MGLMTWRSWGLVLFICLIGPPLWVFATVIYLCTREPDSLKIVKEIPATFYEIFVQPFRYVWFFSKAERRARRLLYQNLPKSSFFFGSVYVKGGNTGKVYRIGNGGVVLEGIAEFCVGFERHGQKRYPPSDYKLAMALQIMHNEWWFLDTANVMWMLNREKAVNFYSKHHLIYKLNRALGQ